jgi:GWxTD domain-containing protein
MLALLTAALLSPQADTTALRVYSYWRDPDVTNVVALVSIPLADLSYGDDDGNSRIARYEIGLRVRDDADNVLLDESWGNRVRVGMGEIPASSRAVENVSFDLRPGTYRVAFEVTDSISGNVSVLEREIEASEDKPLMGSVMLAHSIEPATEGEPVPAGALVRNGYVISPDVEGRTNAEGAAIRLYTEVYPPASVTEDDAATVQVVLTPESNPGAAQAAPPIRKRYPAGGGLEIVNMPIDGIEPGAYRVALSVAFGDTSVVVEDRLVVEPPTTAVSLAGTPTQKLFAGLNEAQVDSVWERSKVISLPRERRHYEGLSAEGKRNFLEDFWARRDPVAGGANEAYQEFRERVEFANAEFDFAGNAGEGWSTARGRVWILRGAPFERIQRRTRPDPMDDDRVRAAEHYYEIWRYAGGRNDIFIFFDQTGWQNFHQVFSTDPEEVTQPGWEGLFPREDLRFIEDVVGVRADNTSRGRARDF